MSELKERFIKTLKLKDEDVVSTPDACYFVAIGAAICDEAKLTTLKELTELSKTALNALTETKNHSEPLFVSRDEYDAFVKDTVRILLKGSLLTTIMVLSMLELMQALLPQKLQL